jgi:predicted unusual protein kinase regulating ubiquinone biosynthesis (AarF/ABC1/UbiB family)
MMEEEIKGLKNIPTSKISRATKLVGTGVKVGGNYIKYFAKKTFDSNLTKDSLHEDNANDIYKTLSEMKGSALKVAQMMSMDDQVLPKSYQDKFSMAQYKAPALSYPLILKTFQQFMQKKPLDIFDEFSKNAIHAASIGQVHKARIKDKFFAVKIQYPGVADSISSDLKLVKPFASQLLKMKASDMNVYLEELESKLIEETNYSLELKRSNFISKSCSHINNLRFSNYYPELSSKRILTMDWLEGFMFPDFLKSNPKQEIRNQIGQAMWDFYLFQMKTLRMVHADPHPGNFIVNTNNELCVIDFGCVKEIPKDFFDNYFQLLRVSIFDDETKLNDLYQKLDFIKKEDTDAQKEMLRGIYKQMISLIAKPFHAASFDFGNDAYFKEIYDFSESISKNKEIRSINSARSSKHALYIMRTFFGLYALLNQLKAEVKLNYTLD